MEAPDVIQLPNPTSARDWARLYLSSSWGGLHLPDLSDLECFCFFIGYGRSGHSLIGSLLNAHPEVTISHELDALRFVQKHFSRAQIFSLILHRDHEFGAMGRTWTDYDYRVPHQHQGEHVGLKVIGDKRGSSTSQLLGAQPGLLDRLRRTVRLPLRAIHVTRNPFDIIATQLYRTEMSLPDVIEWFTRSCRSVQGVKHMLAPSELLDVSHEAFVADPRRSLTGLCEFLGVDPDPSYLEDCVAILWPSAKPSRQRIEWAAEDRGAVEDLIAEHDFLRQYSFED